MSDIKPGDRVRIRDAYGHWRDDPVGWPAEDVQPAEEENH